VEESWQDPIYSGEWDGWEMKSLLVDEKGEYYFNIKAFNGPINFYWGDRKPKHNPFMNESTLGFNPQNGCMRYFLKNGHVYAQEQEQKLPGEYGDHLIRWSNDNNGTVMYFFNIADIGVDVTRPFVIHSASSDHEWWKNKIPLTLTDASGWGSVKILKKKNTYYENGKNSMYLIIAYGAYRSDGESNLMPLLVRARQLRLPCPYDVKS
jgi:hypothetical protein